jgi:adenylosuccinate synthase
MKSNVEPVYQSFEGWKTDITTIKNFDELPEKMKIYIQNITNYTGLPVGFISNGPGRDQLITNS